MENFVQQYYATGTVVPDEVLLSAQIENETLVQDWLTERKAKKVKLGFPKRGNKTKLVELAKKNAAASFVSRSRGAGDVTDNLEKLKKRLKLKRIPRRIECYDIAHIQGTNTVASMVVFLDGLPEKSYYKKFKVKSVENNDFASMYEVMTRRFSRALAENAQEKNPDWAFPDLVVVDGGKGQLHSALAALKDLKIEIMASETPDFVGIAKETENSSGVSLPDRIFLRNTKDSIKLRANTSELYLISRLRDEAHRFANTFHRKIRKTNSLKSSLDGIPGIGPIRKRNLILHFGNLKSIRDATIEELLQVKGMNLSTAKSVKDFFTKS